MSITPLPGLSEDRYLFPSGMTETERMFVFTALAILIGDYLRRMFPPLAWWIIIPILCTLVIYVLFIRNARLTRGFLQQEPDIIGNRPIVESTI